MDFRVFSQKFGNFQGQTMVFQGIFNIFKQWGGADGWVKAKPNTTFVNLVKNEIFVLEFSTFLWAWAF